MRWSRKKLEKLPDFSTPMILLPLTCIMQQPQFYLDSYVSHHPHQYHDQHNLYFSIDPSAGSVLPAQCRSYRRWVWGPSSKLWSTRAFLCSPRTCIWSPWTQLQQKCKLEIIFLCFDWLGAKLSVSCTCTVTARRTLIHIQRERWKWVMELKFDKEISSNL